LKTFTIRFEGEAFDETPYAKIVSRAFATDYIEASPQMGELSALLPKLIWHMDLPLAGDTGFAYYAASRLAAQHVKVSLTGHGGDELFGGYPAQLQAAFGSQVSASHAQANGGSASWVQRLGRLWRRQGVRGLVDRLQNRLKPNSNQFEKLWIDLHSGLMPQNSVLNPAFLRSLAGYSPIDDYLRPLRAVSDAETLDRCLYHDLKSYLPGLLHAEDRMSMAFSVESRVPLLDHHIIEFLATVPPSQKLPRREPKALLCDAIGPLLPDEIMQRKTKANFATPIREWLQTDLPPLARDVLLSPRCLDRGVLDPDELRSKTTRPGQFWIGLNIELWHRIFIDNDPIEVEQKAEVESVREMQRPDIGPRAGPIISPRC
jgi:asparagine synthase (glutamine-hydrolysing)